MGTPINILTAPQLCKRVGDTLRISRLNKNLTQKQVAEICQCSSKTIKKIEKGDTGVALLYIARYIEATNIYQLLDGLEGIHQYPTILKTKVTYSKRSRSKKQKL